MWLDRGVGTVLWALSRRGVAHNTLAIFTSDSGSTDKVGPLDDSRLPVIAY